MLPGAELLGDALDEERNIEINRSMLKADLVFRIRYKGKPSILNLELQTEDEPGLELRLLQYDVGLYAKHKVPVLSAIIYPFETTVRPLPYKEECADEIFLVFHYKVICLWKLDAQPIVKNHIIALYTLLPAMQGAKPDLLKRALEEIVQRYSRQEIGSHFLRFYRIMWRSKTMSYEEKQEVEEELYMQYQFDEFIDENPLVLERVARGKVEGKVEGKIEGKIEGLQESILNILQVRFSVLAATTQAQQAIAHIQDVEKLKQLQQALLLVSGEQAARVLLELPEEGDLL